MAYIIIFVHQTYVCYNLLRNWQKPFTVKMFRNINLSCFLLRSQLGRSVTLSVHHCLHHDARDTTRRAGPSVTADTCHLYWRNWFLVSTTLISINRLHYIHPTDSLYMLHRCRKPEVHNISQHRRRRTEPWP